jgi:hypothetical protein
MTPFPLFHPTTDPAKDDAARRPLPSSLDRSNTANEHSSGRK